MVFFRVVSNNAYPFLAGMMISPTWGGFSRLVSTAPSRLDKGLGLFHLRAREDRLVLGLPKK